MTDRHPLFYTLDDGAYLALLNDSIPGEINFERWRAHYHADSIEEVKAAFDFARKRIRDEQTKLEPNSEHEMEGK